MPLGKSNSVSSDLILIVICAINSLIYSELQAVQHKRNAERRSIIPIIDEKTPGFAQEIEDVLLNLLKQNYLSDSFNEVLTTC